jgi:hypothetical protein
MTRKKSSVSSLDSNKNYLYEVFVLIKDPKSLIKNNVVKETKYMGNSVKEYYYNSYKWDQKTISTGVVYSLDPKGNINIPDLIESGNIGSTATYQANISSINSLKIKNFSISRIDFNKIFLSWMTNGNVEDYDHFIIIKEVNQKREFLGAFSQFETTDLIKKSDMGLVSYHIIPVFKNYDAGSSFQSNSIILDPQEFNTDIIPM